MVYDLVGLRWDLQFCISNKFPGMVYRSHFWAVRYWMIMNYKSARLLKPSGTKELVNMKIQKDKFPNRGWNTEVNVQWEDKCFLKQLTWLLNINCVEFESKYFSNIYFYLILKWLNSYIIYTLYILMHTSLYINL